MAALPKAEDCKQYVCDTNMGSFTVALFDKTMPITASNWADLATSGFYKDLTFHRVIKDFMLQFGCPYSKGGNKGPHARRAGTGGPKAKTTFKKLGDDSTKYTRNGEGNIDDELTHQYSNAKYTLSMANTGRPNSGGSQFFINTKHNKFLDWFDKSTASAHPVFGFVCDGTATIDKIQEVKTSQPGDKPLTDVKMIGITEKK